MDEVVWVVRRLASVLPNQGTGMVENFDSFWPRMQVYPSSNWACGLPTESYGLPTIRRFPRSWQFLRSSEGTKLDRHPQLNGGAIIQTNNFWFLGFTGYNDLSGQRMQSSHCKRRSLSTVHTKKRVPCGLLLYTSVVNTVIFSFDVV